MNADDVERHFLVGRPNTLCVLPKSHPFRVLSYAELVGMVTSSHIQNATCGENFYSWRWYAFATYRGSLSMCGLTVCWVFSLKSVWHYNTKGKNTMPYLARLISWLKMLERSAHIEGGSSGQWGATDIHLSTTKPGAAFLPRCMECRRGLAMRILSVRLSVCQTRALWQTVRKIIIYHTKDHLV